VNGSTLKKKLGVLGVKKKEGLEIKEMVGRNARGEGRETEIKNRGQKNR